MGEVVIESQFQQGAAKRGIDFLSVQGTGLNARLIVNEAKDYLGGVAAGRFSALGLGKGGPSVFDTNLRKAIDAIRASGFDEVTKNVLIKQLRGKSATIRVVTGPETVLRPDVLQRINRATGMVAVQLTP
jgi:hypothetical protein